MNRIVTYSSGMANRPGPLAFIRSLRRHCPGTPLTALGSDKGFPSTECVDATPGPGGPILGRWKCFAEYIATLPESDNVLLADFRDIVFTRDPFPEFNLAMKSRPLLFFTEHQLTGQHDWCINQAMRMAKLTGSPNSLTHPEINGGLIFGVQPAMLDFCRFMQSETARAVSLGINISDQPIITRWAHHNVRRVAISEEKRLYCHGELVVQNRWASGVSPDNSAVFHQYDRSPLWCGRIYKTYLTEQDRERLFPHVVVSRYTEDVSWLGKFFPCNSSTVYCKGPNPGPGEIVLPNVGFEAQTWFHHFAANYDKLPPVTICLQGNPWAHMKKDRDFVLKRLSEIDPDNFSFFPITERGHGSLQHPDGRPHHTPQPLANVRTGHLSDICIAEDTRQLWSKLFKQPAPTMWYSFYSGQFAVHRDQVLARPRAFYEFGSHLIKTKGEACVAERFWWKVFS